MWIFGILCFLIFFLVAYISFGISQRYVFLFNQGAVSDGVVTQVNYYGKNAYIPTVTFTSKDGSEHSFIPEGPRNWASKGQSVTVMYDPNSPSTRPELKDLMMIFFNLILYPLFGLAFLVVGIFLVRDALK